MAETVGPVSPDDSRVIHFFQEALGWSQKRNPQKWNERPNTVRAACWHATREKFKLSQERVPYHYWQLIAMPACDEVSGYMLSRDIRWRYSKRRVA